MRGVGHQLLNPGFLKGIEQNLFPTLDFEFMPSCKYNLTLFLSFGSHKSTLQARQLKNSFCVHAFNVLVMHR